MPSQMIRQPNGRFALWSTIVDDFVLLDATADEMIRYRVAEGCRRDYVEWGLQLLERGEPYIVSQYMAGLNCSSIEATINVCLVTNYALGSNLNFTCGSRMDRSLHFSITQVHRIYLP